MYGCMNPAGVWDDGRGVGMNDVSVTALSHMTLVDRESHDCDDRRSVPVCSS